MKNTLLLVAKIFWPIAILFLVGCSAFQPPTVGSSLTTPAMALDVKRQLNTIENAYLYFVDPSIPGQKGSLGKASVVNRSILNRPDARGKWTESWVVLRRGGTATYKIELVPLDTGGITLIRVMRPPILKFD